MQVSMHFRRLRVRIWNGREISIRQLFLLFYNIDLFKSKLALTRGAPEDFRFREAVYNDLDIFAIFLMISG